MIGQSMINLRPRRRNQVQRMRRTKDGERKDILEYSKMMMFKKGERRKEKKTEW